ncbi:MAG: hypothetical protein EPN25_14950 [Nitrospirae bacterium]|nr:MAG: hypothetical protein EPN25_14950 [Nitrospirota bacterium]
MKRGIKLFLACVMLTMTLVTADLFAAEGPFELNAGYSIKEVLTAQVGKRVSVRTDAGETFEGTVTRVGDHLLHISKLSGKDFYDAVVRIDRINSVVLKVRGN